MYQIPQRNRDLDKLTCEMLTEVLYESKGLYHSALKKLKDRYQISICISTLKRHVQLWGMEEWINEIRAAIVEECFEVTYKKGVEKQDNQCLMYVQDKYGHHLDFLTQDEVKTESYKGWKELLDRVKQPTERETAQEHTQQ